MLPSRWNRSVWFHRRFIWWIRDCAEHPHSSRTDSYNWNAILADVVRSRKHALQSFPSTKISVERERERKNRVTLVIIDIGDQSLRHACWTTKIWKAEWLGHQRSLNARFVFVIRFIDESHIQIWFMLWLRRLAPWDFPFVVLQMADHYIIRRTYLHRLLSMGVLCSSDTTNTKQIIIRATE